MLREEEASEDTLEHGQGSRGVGRQGGPGGDGIAAEEDGDNTVKDITVKIGGLEIEVLNVDCHSVVSVHDRLDEVGGERERLELEDKTAGWVAYDSPTERGAHRSRPTTGGIEEGQDSVGGDSVAIEVGDVDNTAADEGLDVHPGRCRHVLTGPDFRESDLVSDPVVIVGCREGDQGVEGKDVVEHDVARQG